MRVLITRPQAQADAFADELRRIGADVFFFPTIEKRVLEEGETSRDFPHGRGTVLFVDDEQALVEIGREILEYLGYQVETLTSSVDALEHFRKQPAVYDLVITDLTMPNMTGEKMALEMLKIRPDLPIILCTGYSDYFSEKDIRKLGIRALAIKPLVMQDLAETIRTVLDIG